MNSADRLLAAISSGNPHEVEGEWLGLMAEDPGAVGVFCRAAKGLGRHDLEQVATMLLELLDEQLCEDSLWSERLELLKQAGRLFLRTGRIHETVVATVHSLYGDRQDELAIALEAVGLDKGKDETPKLWDKVERLRNLLLYEQGVIVSMAGKGVGRITEVNLALQALKVDFEEMKGVAVGLRAAGKLLAVLPPGHVLRRKLEQPDVLAAMSRAELLELTLSSFDRPLKAGEIREILKGTVSDKSWSSWWTAARRLPQLLAEGSGAKATYVWLENVEQASEQLLDQFDSADRKGKLEIFKRAHNHGGETAAAAFTRLSEYGRSLLDDDLAAAYEVWLTLARSAPPKWSPEGAIAATEDPLRLLATMPKRPLRERTLELLESEREDWQKVFGEWFLSEQDSRILAAIIDRLYSAGAAIDSLLDRALSQPTKTPAAFTWTAERAAEDEQLRARWGLRLLRQIAGHE